MPPPDPDRIADVLEVTVTPGHQVLCVSDLHLRPERTTASSWAIPELAKALDDFEGPGTLILNGDVLEMWFIQPPDGIGSLEAHGDLIAAVARFRTGPERRVIYVIGNHDGRLGWDGELLEGVAHRLGCEFAFAAELVHGAGRAGNERRVRVEHGHAYDPANAFHDPRDPAESPLGMHLVEEIMPEAAGLSRGALDGFDRLADPRSFMRFVSSRYFYRRLIGVAGWIVIPLTLLYLLRIIASLIVIVFSSPRAGINDALGAKFLGLDTVQLMILAAIVTVAALWARRSWQEGSAAVAGKRGRTPNTNTRAACESFVAGGYAGMVSAHTHRAELSPVTGGFYANTGSCSEVIARVPARLKLPAVFLPRLQLYWVVLEAHQNGWEVQLFAARRHAEGATRIERLVAGRAQRHLATDPAQVAQWPSGPFLHE